MTQFEFVSHQDFPEDEYIKEAVVLCLEGKYRVTYLKRILQNGSQFWSVVSTSVKKNGKKMFLPGFEADSTFLNRDITNYLNERLWESPQAKVWPERTTSMKDVQNDEMPF